MTSKTGKIALEEHFAIPPLSDHMREFESRWVADPDKYVQEIEDIGDIRIKKMDKYDVSLTVLSHTGPAVQDEFDQAKAEAFAAKINDFTFTQVKLYPGRFAAFAALSMHDPSQAASELRRCVRELGFVGALVYDTQRTGSDGSRDRYYSGTEFDVFWAELVKLDVPLYIHPRNPTGRVLDALWDDKPFLVGPPLQFGQGVVIHVLELATKGVFDRFPAAKIVIGHLGEHLPFQLWRTNHWFEDIYKHNGLEKTCRKTLVEYFRRNIWITTSGAFSTSTLRYCMEEIGKDKIMFSIDYPYETFEMACEWWDGLDISPEDKELIGFRTAKKLLKLQ